MSHASLSLDDTIAAIASAPGEGLRGIVRISGPETLSLLSRIASEPSRFSSLKQPTVLQTELRLSAPLNGIPCDVYCWPTGRSYTRQPSAEVHTFGSGPVLDAILEAVCKAGARTAEPGEFTMRAFLAGRLDLTQAEAVLGVIDAQSQADLDASLQQLAGGVRTPLGELREELLELLSHLEAGLDFVEEDIEFISTEQLLAQLRSAAGRIEEVEQSLHQREDAADPYRVVLAGSPNAGKSSLLNALAGCEAAIVSDQAGTTRDYLRRHVDMQGLPCLLIDTAGVGDAADAIDESAQSLAREQSDRADLRLFCLPADRRMNAWEQIQIAADVNSPTVVVLTKCDAPITTDFCATNSRRDVIQTSAVTGQGLEELRSAIGDQLERSDRESRITASLTSARCRESLRSAAANVTGAIDAAARQLGDELVASEVRSALEQLGKVVGTVYTDDVLDRVFSRFCIGK